MLASITAANSTKTLSTRIQAGNMLARVLVSRTQAAIIVFAKIEMLNINIVAITHKLLIVGIVECLLCLL